MSSLNQGSQEFIIPITIDEWFRSHRLDELKNYLDVTEKYLQEAKTDFEAWSDEQVKRVSPEKQQEFYDLYYDDYWRYAAKFPRILRNSFLVSALSLLEYELGLICNRLKKERQIPISWSDLWGNTLKKAKLYFRLAKLKLTFNDKNWQEINNYYLIRNCIVHNNGSIKGSKYEAKLRAYVTKNKITDKLLVFPEVRPHDEIALTKQFCEHVVETMQAFFVGLEKSINPESK